MYITVRVPATSANLGPGFDALGLALDLWNEAIFHLAIEPSVQVRGEGAEKLSRGENNLIIRSAQKLAEHVGKRLPPFHVDCINRIPLSSGIGSSAAAKLTGLLGANLLLGKPLSLHGILELAAEMEGHADNVAPALLGGLVVSTMERDRVLAHKIQLGTNNSEFSLHPTVVLPDFQLSTEKARSVLPRQVAIEDAVHNVSRAVMVAEAFRTGDLNLLGQAMSDMLHQPYRLPLIPGGQAAVEAAQKAGAVAALSGAGPGMIAFSAKQDPAIGEAMRRAFEEAGLQARIFHLRISTHGAEAQIR